ncbi:MAG: 2-dehydropantoate 2-reductase [Gammaproteobacteria bacterium]
MKLLTRYPGESARLITLEDQGHLATHGFHVDHGDTPIRRLLITVKAHQTAIALDTIAHRITPDTVLLFLQNGMGAWQIAGQRFPDPPACWARPPKAPGARRIIIVHAGRGETWIGTLQPRWQTAVDAVVQQWRPTLFRPQAVATSWRGSGASWPSAARSIR